MTKFILPLLVVLICGCQTTEETGLVRPADKPFGEDVNRPFNDMIANAWRGETIIGEVYFEYDKDDLTDITKEQLQSFVYEINRRKGQVMVSGHADHNNTDEYNIRLGYLRALQVADYLRSAGVWDERIVVRSFGETRPAASNWHDSTRTLNRRVVVSMFNQAEGLSGDEALRVIERQRNEGDSSQGQSSSPMVESLLGSG